MQTIGFIGIGVMGVSMARNLMRAGYSLSVYTRTPAKAQVLVDEGAVWCDTAARCASRADAVITIVGYPQDVEEVYFGSEGIFAGAKPGTHLIDMTTTDPTLAQTIYREAKKSGMFALDAPVSGGDTGAREGTLSIMVGGDEDVFARCLPLFKAMGKTIVYSGSAGCGQHTKMANQIAIAGAISGVCEALVYAQKHQLNLRVMLDTISQGAAGSWQLNYNAPRIVNGDFSPGFYIKHFIKDLRIALEQAEAADVHLDVTELVYDRYKQLEDRGFGDLGTQALIKYYE